jgi:hypothetical protein
VENPDGHPLSMRMIPFSRLVFPVRDYEKKPLTQLFAEVISANCCKALKIKADEHKLVYLSFQQGRYPTHCVSDHLYLSSLI